jgi:hypothetical protein
MLHHSVITVLLHHKVKQAANTSHPSQGAVEAARGGKGKKVGTEMNMETGGGQRSRWMK